MTGCAALRLPLSYEYIAGRLLEVAPGIATSRVVIAHLGNGAQRVCRAERA